MKTFVTVVAAILCAAFILYGLVKARIEWNERAEQRQFAETQHRADLWCQKANNDSTVSYWKQQGLCGTGQGWSGQQPDGQLISDNGYVFLGDAVDKRMQGDREEHARYEDQKKQAQARADAWCQKINEDSNLHYWTPAAHSSFDDYGTCGTPTDGKLAKLQPNQRLVDPDDGYWVGDAGEGVRPVDCITVMRDKYPSLSIRDLGCPNGK